MKPILFSCLLLLFSACAIPQVQPILPRVNIPHLQFHPIQQVTVEDKTQLPLRSWIPHHNPKAVIIAVHGFNDYGHAFEIPGEYMQQHGFAVYAYDQRGFGRAPFVGIWPGEENLIHDLSDITRAIKKRHPHIPIYILGESMGGAVAVIALTRHNFPKVNGLILSAPAVWGGEAMNPFFRSFLWLFAHTMPQHRITGQDLHILASDNIDMLRALGNDPLVIKQTRIDAIYGLVQLMGEAYKSIDKIKGPVLILYGAHDQVIPPVPVIKAIDKINVEKACAYYPLGYHMLLRDRHGDIVVDDIIAWIVNRRLPLPSHAKIKTSKFLKYAPACFSK